MEGVNPRLVAVVPRALMICPHDFGVIEGVRALARQRQLVDAGKSWTMDSRHIEGEAVDLYCLDGNRATWELSYYSDLAEAMRQAATELGVRIKWGGDWTQVDAVHFELG